MSSAHWVRLRRWKAAGPVSFPEQKVQQETTMMKITETKRTDIPVIFIAILDPATMAAVPLPALSPLLSSGQARVRGLLLSSRGGWKV